MIKNKIKFINLFLTFTLLLFILSCSSDTPAPTGGDTTPENVTLDGEWTSGDLSYHLDLSCTEEGLTLEDFADSTIISNFEVHAWELANYLCNGDAFLALGYTTEEECVEANQISEIQELIDDLSEEDILNYQDKISSGYEYENMILTIFEDPNIYSISYDGQCLDYEIADSNDCEVLNGSWEVDECIITSKEACQSSFVNGTWDDGFEGSWEENLEGNYTLDDFEMFDESEKELIFDGASIFIIIDSNENECVCDEDVNPLEIPTGSGGCVLDAECIWIEKNCVSLSFSK